MASCSCGSPSSHAAEACISLYHMSHYRMSLYHMSLYHMHVGVDVEGGGGPCEGYVVEVCVGGGGRQHIMGGFFYVPFNARYSTTVALVNIILLYCIVI